MQQPLVSIIVPVYNLAPYLPTCINSLIYQTYANTEIIFINDASTDTSLQILKTYQQKNANIQIISQSNAGPGPARNKGLDHASGAYVLFVDGDDCIDVNTVAACVFEALHTDADIICFGFKKVLQDNSEEKIIQCFEYKPENYTNSDYVISFFSENSHRKDKLNTATMGKFYKRSLLENNHIRFRLDIFEDSPFMLEAVWHATCIRFIKGTFYTYYIRDKKGVKKSITSKGISAYKIAKLFEADELIRHFLISKNAFQQYRTYYYCYHNTRVLQYGGYFETYVAVPSINKANGLLTIAQLRQHKQHITFNRKGLYRTFRKRVFILKAGIWLSAISVSAVHCFFCFYEKKWAPK